MILLEGIIFLKEDIKLFEINKEIGKIFEKSKFNFKKGKLYYKSKDTIDISNTEINIEVDINKYYHIFNNDIYFASIIFENKSDDDKAENFDCLDENIKEDIKKIREVFSLGENKNNIFNSTKIEKIVFIKDEFAKYLLNISYGLIYDIENYMRELIFKVMSFKASKNWFEKELPENIDIKQDRKDLEVFGLDFSHLSSIIFDRNEKSKAGHLYEKLESAKKCEDLNFEEIINLIPKSNWQKYFSDININEKISFIKETEYKEHNLSDEETIKRLLKEINQSRNKIAHNNLYIKNDFYTDLSRKIDFLKELIKYAIDDLNNNILKNTQDKILYRLNKNEKNLIKTINILIEKIANYYNNQPNQLKDIFNDFKKENCIKKINFYFNLKERILKTAVEFDDEDIFNHIETINELINNLEDCPKVENDIEKDENIILKEEP